MIGLDKKQEISALNITPSHELCVAKLLECGRQNDRRKWLVVELMFQPRGYHADKRAWLWKFTNTAFDRFHGHADAVGTHLLSAVGGWCEVAAIACRGTRQQVDVGP